MSRHPFHLTREEAEVQRLARGFPKFVGKLCLEPVSLPVILPHSWSESGGAPPRLAGGQAHSRRLGSQAQQPLSQGCRYTHT